MLSADEIASVKAQAYAGFPSKLKDICKVYPSTMAELLEEGVVKYSTKLNLLLMTEQDVAKGIKEKIGTEVPLDEINVLEFLLQSAEHDDSFLLESAKIGK